MLSVKEGCDLKNRISGRKQGKARNGDMRKAVMRVLGAVFVLLAGIGIWRWMDGRRGGEAAPQDESTKKVVTVPVAAKPAKAVAPARQKAAPKPASSAGPAAMANAAEPVLEVKGEVAEEAGLAETNGEEEVAVPKKEKLFKHGAEQLLALATPAAPGMSVPPLPAITDEGVAEDLKKAMSSTISAAPSDTERDLEVKLTVANQKEEFRELRKQGMTFTEYLKALREKFNDDAKFLSEARQMDESLFHDGEVSDADYKAYRAELNRHLLDRGLPELDPRDVPEGQETTK